MWNESTDCCQFSPEAATEPSRAKDEKRKLANHVFKIYFIPTYSFLVFDLHILLTILAFNIMDIVCLKLIYYWIIFKN